ncbi:substrate-binding domain-containing protein [Fervidobacterium sp. 2310opik-2]|uniref:substrate-binding domain-containing protein n=1 Tax=Fervidobacterium sp. 2310opik-2 TaxID=1755815 RepID=UPI0013E017E7|nr:substrate-binding domain-containing protein [Fervidobacterium sp. 2310opik-2]KAF2961750.1 alanine racemase [Fervidobacterium sp. 2310opik-2]
MANIREVAKLANVSIATVSRVLNGSDRVSEETRKRVLNAVKKLNYKPAFSFKEGTGRLLRTIGVLMPDIRGYHYSDIVMAIEEYAYTKQFDIMLALPKWEVDIEEHILDQYFRRKVDGIILGELFGGQKLIEKFTKSGVPVVVIDFRVDEIDFDVVNVDNVTGGYSAIKYLYDNGHRNILFIPGPEVSPAALDREKGIRKFVEKLPNRSEVNIYYGEHRGYNSEHGWVSVTQHLKKYGLNFTAIFAVNDWAALGAIDALKDHGIKVPDEVSIIGFDDAPFAQYTSPRLTTVMQPRWEMGVTAAQLLISRILDKKARLPRNVILPTKLIERESVKKIR